MKARIKSTGDIFPIAPYAKVTLNVCDDRGTPYEVDFEDVELIQDNISESDTNWQSFRREAAKDFISGMLANVSPAANQWTTPEIVGAALEIADELIKQIKQQ